MKTNKRIVVPGLLVLALLLAGCQSPPSGPTPAPTAPPPDETTIVETTPAPEPTPTPALPPTATPEPVTEADLDAALNAVRDFLAGLASGDYRMVYGSLLTTAGQQRLADLVLGRLALADPSISFFELLGAQPVNDRVAVDVIWRESFEGAGDLGTQEATVFLARQANRLLVDDVRLGAYVPAATPVPPPLPRAETLTSPVLTGQEMRFQASGFQIGETVLMWLELADGTLLEPQFGASDGRGVVEIVYDGGQTGGLTAGRWIWWAQALRDSTRNTGISFDVQTGPTATPIPTQPSVAVAPTQPPAQPTAAPAATTPPVAAPPTPTPTPAPPSTAYPAPILLWPEPVTSREFGSALVVEFVPVADTLAADEFYELILVARNPVGVIYNAGRVLGKGDPNCDGVYGVPCLKMIADEGFMRAFHGEGFQGMGEWYIQVVRQSGADQYTAISPPSEARFIELKSR